MTFVITDNILTNAHPGTSSSIVIPSSVLSIVDGTKNEYAFKEFTGTTFSLSFEAGSKLTRIGKYSFYSCKKLTSIDFSNANSLKTIGDSAFASCTSLTSLHFPSSLESLDNYGTFYKCSSLTEVTFPDDSKITTIASGSFWRAKITQFRVPASCTSLNGESLGMTDVERFTVQEGNKAYKEYNGSIFSSDLTKLIVHRKTGELSLPPETMSIGFIALSNLKADIKIRKNISTFNKLAFFTYQGKRITIFGVFNCVNARMFESCNKLIEVKFYNEVNAIEASSFHYCSKLRRVVFLYPVKSFNKTAFPDIRKICFYGEVSSIRSQIEDVHINECKLFFNTCFNKQLRRSSISTSLLPAIFILVYS